VGHPTWHDSLYDHDRATPPAPAPDPRDTAPLMARSIVVDDAFDWQGVRPPRTSIEDTVVYEVHVKGFTARHPGVPAELRGTYLGMAHPAAVQHLVDLGVTAVELLPIHHLVDDAFLIERGLRNYWGYNSIGFFAPDHRYASLTTPGAAVAEFKTLVRELHRAGIEVFLDVVYNHSGETAEHGPTICFRGIDNAAYYRLNPDSPDRYVDVTGCGNTFQTGHPVVRELILDSLRYWVETMGGRRVPVRPRAGPRPRPGRVQRHSELFEAIKSDPIISRSKLIAESWDLGENGYQVGRFSAGWSEWNDQYRDAVRRFWLGSDPWLQSIGARVTGSADLFRSSDRRPSASVNSSRRTTVSRLRT
jgi:glycogen operon protein